MDIKLLTLKLQNFKGIKQLEINFEGKNTNIYGKNATGKTTIFDAFKWLFFDKDSNDRKDFNIKTLDSNNKPIHFLEHSVEAVLLIDGQDTIFKKVFQEKWVKRRGQEQQEFAGHETSYWIDEVPIKKKDYEEKINSIIPENLFKLITDPSFFNNQMSWKERRELLINISGVNITDEEILDSHEQFSELKENLNGRKVEDYKKVISSKVKELNNEKEKIPIRIDELNNTLITDNNINYEDLEKEKNICNEELEKIELQMTDVQARAKENMKTATELAIAKNELHNLKFKLEVEHSNKYSSESIRINNEKNIIEGKIRNNKQTIQDLELQIEKDNSRKQELYKKWDEVANKKIEFESDSFICPTCKRPYDTEKVEEMKQEFINNFNISIENEKQVINKEGQAINIRINDNTEKRNSLYIENEQLNKELEKTTGEMQEYEKNKSNIEAFDVTSLPQYQEKLKEIEALEEIVNNLVSEDITEIQNKKTNIIEQINNIDKQLNERVVQEKTKTRIEELEKEEENIAHKIQELEAQQYQIEEFTKTKVEVLESSINSKFKLVKFKLFDTQINGGLVECCDTLVTGVPYQDVNNAHKILAGLDIINILSEFYNITAPIFIDNKESINELNYANAQVISLIVTNDPTLRIEVV